MRRLQLIGCALILAIAAFASSSASARRQPPPPPPVNVTAPTITGNAVQGQRLTTSNATWTNSPTSAAYQWQRCDAQGGSCVNINRATAASYTVASADVGHALRARVTVRNAGGSGTAVSAPTSVVPAPADTTPPTQPGTPTARVISDTEIDLSWGASTDNVGVANYQVERDAVQIAAPHGNSYNDTGLDASTSYTYRVRAIDAKGNLSAYSTSVTATTRSGNPPPPTCNGYVGITFDDGPTSMSQQYINALEAGGANATFFLLGSHMQDYPSIASAELAAGNDIENHTMDHQSFTGDSTGTAPLSDSKIASEISGQAQVVLNQTGYTEHLFRPPYGDMNQHTFDVVEGQLGWTSVMWTADTNDWQEPPTATIVSRFLAGARDQAVILQHDGYPNTLAAIPQELAGLKSMGLCPGMIVPDPANTNGQYDYNGLPMNWKVVAWPTG